MNNDLSIKGMTNSLINMIEKVEEEYYNGNVFELAIYLYMRYGEIPFELENDETLEEIQNIIINYKQKNSLFDEKLNSVIDNLILERGEQYGLL